MLKQWIKYLLAFCLYYLGIVTLYVAVRGFRHTSDVVLLGYHRVLDLEVEGYDYSQTGLVTSVGYFVRQLNSIQRRYQVISLAQLLQAMNGTRSLPARCSIIALDGWWDSYEHAFPMIQSTQVPMLVYLTTDLIGTRKAFWHTKLAYILLNADLSRCNTDRLNKTPLPGSVIPHLTRLRSLGRSLTVSDIDGPIEALKGLDSKTLDQLIENLAEVLGVSLLGLDSRRFLLSWEEVREMAQQAVELGSHSCTHRSLTTLPRNEAKMEIVQSKQVIEDHVGVTVHAFACPNGDCNAEIRQSILDAGYKVALYRFNKRDEWRANQFTLRRICVHDGMCTSPWGRFSRSLFAFEVSGIRSGFG